MVLGTKEDVPEKGMPWHDSVWLGVGKEYEGQTSGIREKGLEKVSHTVKEDGGSVCQDHRELGGPGIRKESELFSKGFWKGASTTIVTCKL